MLKRLLPRETNFFDYFERLAATIVRAGEGFVELAATGTDAAERAKRIKDLEHEADVITHDCVEALHKTFITPFERDDIYRLIGRMDDIMDYLETAADQWSLYDLAETTEQAKELADVVLRSAREIEQAVAGLRDMKHAEAITARCVQINVLENEADQILREAVAGLFRNEKDPFRVIKWKSIYENLEIATDKCEDVANILEGVVLENV